MVRDNSIFKQPPPEKTDLSNSIYSVAYSPDCSYFIVAVGDRVLMYDSKTHTLIKNLKGHVGTVYWLAYSKDGSSFASGGADKKVVLWSPQG